MLNIRIDTGRATLAALLFAASMMGGGALAQTDANGAPGKPLQLVQNFKPASKPAATKSAKATAKIETRRHRTLALRKRAPGTLALRNRAPAPVRLAQGPAAAWPAAPALPFAGAAAVAAPSPVPVEPLPSELVVGGQTVQIGSPEELNEIDLAAKDEAASGAAANPQAGNDVPDAAAKSELATAAPPSEIGSAAWLLQVLAALGGAVAAGSVAWFLIGSAPQRMYG
jgi:hypothetical protein